MGKRAGYEPGIFCWADLATSDPAGAKAFYGELFGWESADVPVGEGGTYTMLSLHGDEVGALYELDSYMREHGVTSNWLSHVNVESADETAEQARSLGAMVEEPFDVSDSGRMKIIRDTVGAVFAAWQPSEHIGAGRVNDIGCMTWNELQTREPEKASEFYSALFGWELERMEEDGKLAYVLIKNNGWMNGGIMPMTEKHDDAPPHWLPYFTATSCDAATEDTRKLGGTVMAGPLDMEEGRICVIGDPQGAAFAIFEGDTEE